MLDHFRKRLDSFLGRGSFSTSVPVMDGPLQPNHRLDEAAVLFAADGLDNLLADGDTVFYSAGPALFMRAADGAVSEVRRFDADIACLAMARDGGIAVGLDGAGIVIFGGAFDGTAINRLGDAPLIAPTAAVFLDDKTLLVASGSSQCAASQWKRDLMSLGKTGSLWRVDLTSGKAEALATGLAFPYGLALSPDGRSVLVSEAWAHRVVRVALDGARPAVSPVLQDLPGYPARLVAAEDGGYWLAVFAPRNQLVEFVLREKTYRERMMAEVDPEYWVAPSLAIKQGFREPMQNGALKLLGILKPWAPTFSYGLVVRLNADGHPVDSLHSRADGNRHGITSLCLFNGRLVAGSKGAGEALVSKAMGGDA
ncbi:UNVERIFIED_ORG: strictosidine synthase [Martelella mediterranea]